eukprot:CAMPEP_0196144578 /NCGR_PEP_ID=MMETSP0910-20130528/17038_1 /TAXON_ID=49265 /ORGANISM="Thalassiosira rotula, Strain GSO102" /LENGTH=59 /DNA_ID=CAMNT_0041406273 /DNA_START=87 /DNA_END=263 /DNA_ORIENTATION=-
MYVLIEPMFFNGITSSSDHPFSASPTASWKSFVTRIRPGWLVCSIRAAMLTAVPQVVNL